MKILNLYVLLFIAVLTTVVSCTRDKGQVATVRLALPGSNGAFDKLGSLSGNEQVNMVIISVTGAGISQPILFQWDGHNSNGAPPPAYFEVTVPRGESRLFQALLIMADTSTGASTFYYGDLVKTVQAEESINITASQVTSNSVSDGYIAGRFVNADGSGPSGGLRVYFPIAGKPKMLVARKEIFGGWFSTFALEGANLEYVLDDGQLLFGAPVSVTSASLLSTSTNSVQNMRVQLPLKFYSEGGGASPRKPEAPSKAVLGWFGPGIAGKKLCFLDTARAIPNVYTTSNTANMDTIEWAPLATTPTTIQASVEAANGGVRGGWATSTTDSTQLCAASGTRFIDYISVDDASVAYQNSSLAFRGPFQLKGSSNGDSQALEVSFASNTLTVGWKYLPHVYSVGSQKGLDGSDIFARILATAPSNGGGGNEDFRGSEDGVLCSQLNSLGFTVLASEPVNTSSVDLVENVSITSLPSGFASAFSDGRVQLIVCPYRLGSGKSYFTSAAVYRGQGGGNNSGPMMATTIQLISAQVTPPANVGNNFCTPVFVQGAHNGQPAMFPSNTQVSMTADDGDTSIYLDSSCSSTMTGAVNVYGSSLILYVKRSGSGTVTRNLTAVASNGLTGTASLSITAYDVSTPIPVIKVKAPTSILAYKCYEVSAETWHVDGGLSVPYAFPNTYSSFTWPASNFTYYDSYQGPCEGYTPSNLTIGGYSLISRVYFRYTGSASQVTLQPSHGAFAGDGIGISGGVNIPVIQPGAASQISIKMAQTLQEGRCEKVDFEIVDSNGNLSPAPAALSINLNAGSGGAFYQYSGCSSAQSGPLTMNSGDLKKTLYYKNTTAVSGAPIQVNVSATNSSPSLSGSTNISVTAATASMILSAMPGQTFTDCSGVTGSPLPHTLGSNVYLNLYAVKYNNCLDTDYNASLASISSSGVMSMPAPNAITFVNGVAYFGVTANSAGANSMYVSGSAYGVGGIMNFGTTSLSLFAPANKFNIYMNQAASLVPGACQIFAVIPEDNYGYAQLSTASVTVSLSASGGTVYTDKDCALPLSGGSFNATQSSKFHVFYYKNTTASDAQTISASAAGGYTTINFNTNTLASGSVTAATKWQILGYSGTTIASTHQCLPYISYLADAGGMFVSPGADITNVRLMTSYLNGTTGYITDQFDCAYPYIDLTDVTLSSSLGYRASYATPASNPVTGHRINARDNYSGSSVYTPAYLDLYRSD